MHGKMVFLFSGIARGMVSREASMDYYGQFHGLGQQALLHVFLQGMEKLGSNIFQKLD